MLFLDQFINEVSNVKENYMVFSVDDILYETRDPNFKIIRQLPDKIYYEWIEEKLSKILEEHKDIKL